MELGGLGLLLPLTKSSDLEVKRLAAHALANLSVNAKNQVLMAEKGGIEMLIDLLQNGGFAIQQQAAKSLANLGVNQKNKRLIAVAGGLRPLIEAGLWACGSPTASSTASLSLSPLPRCFVCLLVCLIVCGSS